MNLSPHKKLALLCFFSDVIFYTSMLLLFHYGNTYQQTLLPETQNFFIILYALFLITAPLYYFTKKTLEPNKSLLFFRTIKKTIFSLKKNTNALPLTKEEKTAFLFILVKLFFIPLMTNFVFININGLRYEIQAIQWYSLFLSIIFTIDTAIFAFGYLIESKKLNNTVRSVEPTFFGWTVALLCYPPFNGFIGNYIPWGANDYITLENQTATTIIRIIVVLLLIIYVLATLALGTKASNLTNRGIITKFPYSIIRHPAYTSKNLAWWLTLLPAINLPFALGMLFWSAIYYFRAVTEEKHLLRDPEYQKYCKNVKYRFIPGIL